MGEGTALAQYFEQSVGLRLGHTTGLSYKLMLDEEDGIDLLLTGRDQGLQILGLYEHHKPIPSRGPGSLFLYYGGGLHLGAVQTLRYETSGPVPVPPDPFNLEQNTWFVMGADAIVGLSYRFHGLPLILSYDIKPYVDHIGLREFDFYFWDTALSVRYMLR